jgi:hypothetical protein
MCAAAFKRLCPRRQGISRGRDFDAASVPRVYLQRLCDEGVLQQVARGLYKLAGAEVAGATSLAWLKPCVSNPKGSSPCSPQSSTTIARPGTPRRVDANRTKRPGANQSLGRTENRAAQRRGAKGRRRKPSNRWIRLHHLAGEDHRRLLQTP